MSTEGSQSLVEVQRSLPVPQTRFDQFLLRAHELAEKASIARDEAAIYAVDSEATFQFADTIQAALKADAKELAAERLALTRVIDDFKKVFVDAEKKAADLWDEGVRSYQGKMRAFRDRIQREAVAAVERAQREEMERAQKLEDRAARLKTESGKQKLYEEAESIRQTATLMVTAAAPEPATVASDLRDNWKGEVKEGRMKDALLWLAEHPEWWDIIDLKAAPMKRLAKQYHNVPDKAEPFRFWNDQGFASKRR